MRLFTNMWMLIRPYLLSCTVHVCRNICLLNRLVGMNSGSNPCFSPQCVRNRAIHIYLVVLRSSLKRVRFLMFLGIPGVIVIEPLAVNDQYRLLGMKNGR